MIKITAFFDNSCNFTKNFNHCIGLSNGCHYFLQFFTFIVKMNHTNVFLGIVHHIIYNDCPFAQSKMLPTAIKEIIIDKVRKTLDFGSICRQYFFYLCYSLRERTDFL